MKRRQLILMLGGSSAGAMTIGSGAFSSAQMERGVNVSVVEDDKALVGYRSEKRVLPEDLDGDGRVPLVVVTNQFAQEVTVVDATIDQGGEYLHNINVPNGDADDSNELTPGDAFSITAEPNIAAGKKIDVAVTVRVEGMGVTAEVFGDTETRRFRIENEENKEGVIENVVFPGGGNAVRTVPENVGIFAVEILMSSTSADRSSPEPLSEREWDTEQKLNSRLEGSENSGNVLAVRFVGKRIFLNPNEVDNKSDDRLPDDWDEDKEFGTTPSGGTDNS